MRLRLNSLLLNLYSVQVTLRIFGGSTYVGSYIEYSVVQRRCTCCTVAQVPAGMTAYCINDAVAIMLHKETMILGKPQGLDNRIFRRVALQWKGRESTAAETNRVVPWKSRFRRH